MRARRSLRVILHTENWQLSVSEPRHRAIVEVHVGHFPSCILKALLVHAETMVLAGDFHSASFHISHRMIGPTMPKGEFVGFGS